MPTMAPERLLTVTEAARELGVSPSSLRRWTEEGRLVALRLPGGARRYEAEELERFRRSLRTDAER